MALQSYKDVHCRISKRCLSHAYILLWLNADKKITSNQQIDQLICTELPGLNECPRLYNAVSAFMGHRLCGRAFMNSPCMKDGFYTNSKVELLLMKMDILFIGEETLGFSQLKKA